MAFEIFKLFGSIFVDTSEANNEMDLAGNNAEILGKKFGAVADKADSIRNGLNSAGEGFSKYVTAPIVALGAASVVAFNAVDDGMDVMIKATGATGDAAGDLEKVFKNVSGSVIGSFDDVGGAIGEVNTRFGTTGDGLESMSKDFLKFAEITGVDATQGVQLVSRAMSDAGIDTADYKTILDQLSAASQASGISVESLTENLTKYGAPMRALGFDTQESIAIFAGWEKAGVNTEIAFSGMKKAISNWAAAGKDPREEFKKTLKAIEETPDIASATTMAIETFGQKAGPDLADAIKGGRFSYEEFLAVVENSDGTLDGTYDELLDGGAKFEMSMQNIQESLAGLGETIMNVLAPMMETAAEKIQGVADWFDSLDEGQQEFIVKIGMVAAAIGPVLLILGGLAGAVSNVAGLFATGGILNGALGTASASLATGAEGAVGMGSSLAALTGPVAIVVAAIAGFIAILVGAWQNSETFRKSAEMAFNSVSVHAFEAFSRIAEALAPAKEAFQGFIDGIGPVLGQIGDFIGNQIIPIVKDFINGFIDGFANIIVAIAPFIEAIGNLLSFISNFVGLVFALLNGDWAAAWEFAKAMGQNAVDFLANVFQGLYNWVSLIFQSILDFIKGIWDGIVQHTTDTWNGVVTFLENAWKTIYDNTIGKITEMAKGVAAKWEETKSDTQTKWANIRDDLASKVGEIYSKVTSKIKETADDVASKWQTSKDDSQTKWANIRDDLGTKAGEIFTNVTTKIHEIVTELPKKWDSIKEAASDAWGKEPNGIVPKILSLVGALPGKLFSLAKDMLSELVKGINDNTSVTNLTDAVGGLVQTVLTKFREGFGIASPAKKLFEIGKYMIQGLINGLNGDNLIAFVNSMVEEIKAAFANGNFNLKAAIDFVGSGAAEFFKSIGIGGSDFGSLVAPVNGSITSWFGNRDDVGDVGSKYHEGIDIGVPEGTPVGSAGAGTVIQAGWNGGYGNSITIDHGNGLETLYGHLSEVLVNVGDLVAQLQTIGLSGNTGNSTGPHLHFSVIKDGEQVDPASIFGYASGTNYATAGLHWVGENGRELVNFKGGERVYDAETSELLARGNVTMEVTINSPTALSPAKTAKLLKRSVQELLMT
ncbi:phage tail tape measure protein [Acetobacterium woodii]|uniref:Phage-like tail tape measure protein n=1 Tax=Acetobacterium woodii (strain ATCC 29683 / DSM 1030 / JCM 2381 / KCTC 1655 / WB1) TaxID=931626 RepID=H6LIT4_ACEWD|nr:phage tail tape measure protein [Acetobacterium woodii]AFA49823.1 phage-like tail tape measure protein [Acetobacterium woodii DSM 1030]